MRPAGVVVAWLPSVAWHLDEMFVKLDEERHYPWRAVDRHIDEHGTRHQDRPDDEIRTGSARGHVGLVGEGGLSATFEQICAYCSR